MNSMGRPMLPRDTPNADMIEAYRNHMINQNRAKRTIKVTMELLYRLDRQLEFGLDRAVRTELQAWLAREDWAAKTRSAYRAHIVKFYEWATDEDDPWLSFNPALHLPTPRIGPSIPNPAPDTCVSWCVQHAAEPYRLICIIAAYSGLRPCEIAALRREDVTEKRLIVRHGKGDKSAELPTEPPLWRAVKDLPPGPLVRVDGRPVDYHWVSRKTSSYLHAHGHTATLRNFRSWHGTWLRRHVDLRTVQERMRHSSLNTTQIYTAVTAEELAASTGFLPDFTAAGVDAADVPDDPAA